MSSLFKPSIPTPPAPIAPPPMPDPMSPAVLEAKRMQIAKAANSGRSGTVLTTGGGGGGTYTGKTLGG